LRSICGLQLARDICQLELSMLQSRVDLLRNGRRLAF